MPTFSFLLLPKLIKEAGREIERTMAMQPQLVPLSTSKIIIIIWKKHTHAHKSHGWCHLPQLKGKLMVQLMWLYSHCRRHNGEGGRERKSVKGRREGSHGPFNDEIKDSSHILRDIYIKNSTTFVRIINRHLMEWPMWSRKPSKRRKKTKTKTKNKKKKRKKRSPSASKAK